MVHSVDIVLATYNGSKFIGELLDSIATQTFSDWKIIVRDDGSTDDTLNIIKSYQNKFPQKFEILETGARLGPMGNFSVVLGNASAPYIMFCDQDDVWKSQKIEKYLAELKNLEATHGKDKPLLVHSDLVVVDQALNTINSSFTNFQKIDPARDKLNQMLVQNNVTGCATMFNQALKNIAFPIPPESKMHDHWIGLIAATCGVISYISEPLVLYRQHEENTVGAYGDSILNIIKNGKFSKIRNNINKNFSQAEKLLERCGDIMNAENKNILSSFCSIKNKSLIAKRATILKHKFLRKSLVDNIGMLLLV